MSEDTLQQWPEFIRIIGFGNETLPAIEAINRMNYSGIKAVVATDGDVFMPSESDRMVILLAAEPSRLLDETAKTFHDADALTIGILAVPSIAPSVDFDSCTVAEPALMPEVAKILLDPIFSQPVINFDMHDLHCILRNSVHFATVATNATGPERVNDAIAKAKESLNAATLQATARMAIIISFNKASSEPLVAGEMKGVTEFIDDMPMSVDVIWAVNYNPSLPPNEVRLSLILSGRELPL